MAEPARAGGGRRWLAGASLALASLALPMTGVDCQGRPAASEFRVGASRAELLDAYGPPAHRQSVTKKGEAIWGPIETFWQQVPEGSTVEIWAYPVEGGTLELYFVDGSERVQGTGFAPEGAVFEGRR